MKISRTLLLVVFGVLGACSAENGGLPDVESESAVDKQADALDKCLDDCHAKYASAEANFAAIDDCVEGACQPDDESDPPLAPAACPAVGKGPNQITYSYAAVDSCITRLCCAQATACANDADCRARSACVDTCHKTLD